MYVVGRKYLAGRLLTPSHKFVEKTIRRDTPICDVLFGGSVRHTASLSSHFHAFNSPNIVGMSSLTVGWMRTPCCTAV